MASIKIVRRKNKRRKDGTAPIAIRISKDYTTNYHFLGQYILENDWDEIKCQVKRSHPNYRRINHFLMKELTKANDLFLNSTDGRITTKIAKQKLKGTGGQKSFFEVAAERVKNKYDSGVFSVARSELSILYNLEEFLIHKPGKPKELIIKEISRRRKLRISKGQKNNYACLDGITYFRKNQNLKFRDINQNFITKYKIFCSVYLNHKTRSITNQLIFIRTLFNIAIKNGYVESKYYPFANGKEKIRINSGNKIGLTASEVEKIEALEFQEDLLIWHTHNAWLIAFYFAGIRISDVVKLKWSDFKDNRLYYVMSKNEKALSLKVPDKAKTILEKYRNSQFGNNGYIFPFLKDVKRNDAEKIFIKTRNATHVFNKYLKRIAQQCDIEKNLSNHIARHSFGNIAGDKIHPLMLQKLYRHSDLKTTLNYQANFIHKEADDALDSVINFD
ncbi:tyrosine-type recombinase/integrase [Salegentibacter mishustinae]|uniref:Integrase n=1 Tax=Salegentibacter mishustinae TaxID=270918 RepID=A0A0Q9Z6V3_9FLAO|nr:tyrosine-type recombinase/integrase [Salegentibacter mishustinae]KRG28703.1 integrase [Salegentibacter mishustinae]PNW22568.1 integrase [Salegentibacter mishustinae]GGW77172.1 transposase [Salegentibacter mishustinae]